MSKDNPPPPSYTPVPYDSEPMKTVAKNLDKVRTAVVQVQRDVSTIKDDLLPPVSEAAKEARDGVFVLRGRVTALEGAPLPSHDCHESSRQMRQDTDIAETRTKAESIGRLVWWMLAVSVAICSAAMGFALSSTVSAATAKARLEDLGNVDEDVVRHSVQIQALERAQAEDRKLYLNQIKQLPAQVEKARLRDLTIEEVSDSTEAFPLTPRERDLIERMLNQAKQRARASSSESSSVD